MTVPDKRFNIRVYPDEYRPMERLQATRRDGQLVETAVWPPRDLAGTEATLKAVTPDADRRDTDCLSTEERALIAEVRALQTVPHLAIRCFLVRGDLRLAQALYDRLVLDLGPEFMGQAGDDIG